MAIDALQETERHLNIYARMHRGGLDEVDVRRIQVDAAILLAMALIRHGQQQQALQIAANAVVDIRTLIEVDGRQPEHVEQLVKAYLVIAHALTQLDKTATARQAMRQAIEELQSLADADPNDAALHLRLGDLQLAGADLEEMPAPLARAAIATLTRFASHSEVGARAKELIDKARARIAAGNGNTERKGP